MAMDISTWPMKRMFDILEAFSQFIDDSRRASIVNSYSLVWLSVLGLVVDTVQLTMLPPNAAQVFPVTIPTAVILKRLKFLSSSWTWPEALMGASSSPILSSMAPSPELASGCCILSAELRKQFLIGG